MLTAERLHELIDYDAETGEFRWRVSRSPGSRAGGIAGTINQNGYRHIVVDGLHCKAHRLAWLYVHGNWPSSHIDHINGDTLDNRIANLRQATRSQNIANSKLRKDSTTRFKGVSFNKKTGKYVAYLNHNGARIYLGLFRTPEAAARARDSKARELHGEFARTTGSTLMKIIRLECENVKRLHVVEIRPDGNLVELTGRNGAGKTSVLDSIQWAIEGARHIQSQPIRKGQREAKIKLDLGEVIVTRRFSKRDDGSTDTSVIVEQANGARFQSPQKLLDSFLDALTFDPLAFARSEPKKQFDALRKFVPDVDFAAIDGANLRDFEARTAVNRQAKEARGAAAQIVIPDGTPAEPIDDAALVEELERAGVHNAEIEELKAERNRREDQLQSLKRSAADRRERAERYRKQAEAEEAAAITFDASAAQIDAELRAADPIPAPIDTSTVRTRIAEAKRVNQMVERANQRQAYLETAKLREAQAEKLTQSIEARNAAKHKAIAAATLPIEGLGFGDGYVTLNGVPFEQASDAEQLRASVAIAMAGNPKLRVIRIRDGSLLDSDGMNLLAQMADERDMQVWVERVSTDGNVGFIIEEGRVVGHNGKPKCDGDHAMPPCDDPNCWHKYDLGDPGAITPVDAIEPVGVSS